MFKNPGLYFESFDNCGDCCRIPGIFLPPEIDPLGNHLGMDREELFRRFLIAELFTPAVKLSPAFVISPVKQTGGKRYADLLSDHGYAHALQLEAERWRLERRIGEVAAGLESENGPDVNELASLARRLASVNEDVVSFRMLLTSLRERRTSIRRAA